VAERCRRTLHLDKGVLVEATEGSGA